MASRLNEIIGIVTANSEESVDELLALMAPDNTPIAELQETFEDVIGYDPISYFDKKELSDKLDDIVSDRETPEDVVDTLIDNKDDIVDSAYDQFDSEKHELLSECLNNEIDDRTGWNPSESEDDNDDDDFDDYED